MIFFKKKKEKRIPIPCLVVDYTQISKFTGVEADSNKLIYHFFFKEGELKTKKIRYTEDKLRVLRKIYNIPCFDNTKQKNKLPVYSRVTPSIIRYTQNEWYIETLFKSRKSQI